MHKVGMVFYAIVEELQRLTVQFRLWREAQEAAVLDPVAVAQIQENAIFSAGVLGHWITDSAQPLHVTVHSGDWDSRFPNPKNYVTKSIHGRFESVYVDRAIVDKDIRERMTPVKALGDLDTPFRQLGKKGRSALDLLRDIKRVETRASESGAQVVSVGGRRKGLDGRRWRLSVNGKLITESPERYIAGDLELHEWRFTQ